MKKHKNRLRISLLTVEATVTYYVSGYITRSIAGFRKCSSCADLLISIDNIFTDVDKCILIETKLLKMRSTRLEFRSY